jgi:hypothetical protein
MSAAGLCKSTDANADVLLILIAFRSVSFLSDGALLANRSCADAAVENAVRATNVIVFSNRIMLLLFIDPSLSFGHLPQGGDL